MRVKACVDGPGCHDDDRWSRGRQLGDKVNKRPGCETAIATTGMKIGRKGWVGACETFVVDARAESRSIDRRGMK